MFNKAENIQNARYIEINRDQLRRTHIIKSGKNNDFELDLAENDYGLRCLSYSTYENLDKFNK